MYIDYNQRITLQEDKWEVETTRTGPNDDRHIIWALGEKIFVYIIN